MVMLADVVTAVVGGDTHRDSHTLEIASSAGVRIAALTIANDDAGFAAALSWTAQHAPAGRVVVALEGTCSYGIGLAHACAAAGYEVLEVERPSARSVGAGSPIPVMLTWRWSPRCGCPSTGCRFLVATGRVRRYGSCSPPAPSWSWPEPGRSTGSARCCSPVTTSTVASSAVDCPRPHWRLSRAGRATRTTMLPARSGAASYGDLRPPSSRPPVS